jgi:hypothetical protein
MDGPVDFVHGDMLAVEGKEAEELHSERERGILCQRMKKTYLRKNITGN